MIAAVAHRVGLLGIGISRSLTPPLHVREASRLGLDYRYDTLDPDVDAIPTDPGEALDEIESRGYDAANITHPYKQAIVPHLDELSPVARRLGAVNLVLLRNGERVGHNTDWSGFRAGVLDGLGDAPRRRVAQLGAGGAGSATAYALLDLGVRELTIADGVPGRADGMVRAFREFFPDAVITAVSADDFPRALRAVDGVLNTTPVGMAHHPGNPIDLSRLASEAWVADVVYLPIETELLAAARAGARTTLDGGGMAVGQAVDSLRLITGLEPDAARMRRDFLDLVASHDEHPRDWSR